MRRVTSSVATDPQSTSARPPASFAQRWRDTLAVFSHARRTFRLVAAVDRRLVFALLFVQIADAVANVAIAYVGKRIIDAVVTATRTPGHPVAATLTWVGIELALVTANAGISQWRQYTQVVLRSKLGLHVNLVILEKAANVSYEHFEDPVFMNKMTQARREASARPLDLVNQSLTLVRQGVTLAGYGALLWALGPWALAALVVTAIPPFWAEARYGKALFELQRARTQRNRVGFYLETVLTTETTIKEVKLFALAAWLIGRYREVHESYHEEETALAARRIRAALLLGLLSTFAFYGTYVIIVMRAVDGVITLGAMTLYLLVFRQGQSALQSALGAVAKMYEDNLFMTNLFEFLGIDDDEPDASLPQGEREDGRAPEVVFEHVTFRYPGSERDVLTDVNLTLRAGQTVALVGRNGAGKTTLVKLLVGLYRPTSGRILIDGIDAATLSAAQLRRRVGVIFQDFVRFQFSAGDNVGLGWLPAREDRIAVERAVNDAGAEAVISRLPKGLDTPLGRAFGGDDLSVGQWQRIALARAFMRRSGILVLDEPTAAMDAETEHEIFERFRELKAGRTALLITHRFATVRMADRIVVFDGGRIVEEGTHTELMARDGGMYARMFTLQAEGYRIDAES
jgi:ATP-binding cassette subfamily B protein